MITYCNRTCLQNNIEAVLYVELYSIRLNNLIERSIAYLATGLSCHCCTRQ